MGTRHAADGGRMGAVAVGVAVAVVLALLLAVAVADAVAPAFSPRGETPLWGHAARRVGLFKVRGNF